MPRPQISLAALLVAVLTAGGLLPVLVVLCGNIGTMTLDPPNVQVLQAAAVAVWVFVAGLVGWLVEKYVRARRAEHE